MISVVTCLLAVFSASISASPSAGRSPNICANSSTHFLPHPNDISKYYLCKNGIGREGQCPQGLVFLPKKAICSWRYNIDDRKLSLSASPICANDTTHFLPHPDDQSKYFTCEHGIAFETICSPNSIFDPEYSGCRLSGVSSQEARDFVDNLEI